MICKWVFIFHFSSKVVKNLSPWPQQSLFLILCYLSNVCLAEDSIPEWKLKGFAAAFHSSKEQANFLVNQEFSMEFFRKNHKTVLPTLIDMLDDDDSDVRESAVRTLGQIGGAARVAVPILIEMYKDVGHSSLLRMQVALALSRLGWGPIDKEIVAVLVDTLKYDKYMLARDSAAFALGEMGAVKEVMTALIESNINDRNLRVITSKAFWKNVEKEDEVVSDLIKMLSSEVPRIRIVASEVLASIGSSGKKAIPILIELLRDEVFEVRESAAYGLSCMGDSSEEAVSAVIEIINNDQPRIYAIKALERIGEPAKAGVPALIEALENTGNRINIRTAAASALGEIRSSSEEIIPVLIKILKYDEQNGFLRDAAARSLVSIAESTKEVIPMLIELLKDDDPEVREAVAESLPYLGESAKDVVPTLVELMGGVYTRSLAINTLSNIGEPAKAAIPELIRALKSSEEQGNPEVARALGMMGRSAKVAVPALIDMLEGSYRGEAIDALGRIGSEAKEAVPALLDVLSDASYRARTVRALKRIGYVSPNSIQKLLKILIRDVNNQGVSDLLVFYTHRIDKSPLVKLELYYLDLLEVLISQGSLRSTELLYVSYFSSGGNDKVKSLIPFLDKRSSTMRDKLLANISTNHGKVKGLVKFIVDVLQDQKYIDFVHIRPELAKLSADLVVTNKDSWSRDNPDLVEVLSEVLKETNFRAEHLLVDEVVRSNKTNYRALSTLRIVWVHFLFWVALIVMYPRSKMVQAIFFWNPWIRKFVGLGYVGFLLTWVPPLRRLLFLPFRKSLLMDAGLASIEESSYFPSSKVKTPDNQLEPIGKALANFMGSIILEGDSGLGKSMALRHAVTRSNRISMYLAANRCERGVMQAIQDKLKGIAQDQNFLRKLIYCGAIDIVIDGVNEVSPEVRVEISKFIEEHFNGQFILATQPMEWPTKPKSAEVWKLLPLDYTQIKDFLILQQYALEKTATFQGEQYIAKCEEFLGRVSSERKLSPVMEKVLSNPMDLTVVASLIADGRDPDLMNLRNQQLRAVKEDYEGKSIGMVFPVDKIAELGFQAKYKDRVYLEGELSLENGLKNAVEAMTRHKLLIRDVLSNNGVKKDCYKFRHDKIADFFIAHSFLSQSNKRQTDHMSDPRFRGVYLVLVEMLGVPEAEALEKALVQYAAETGDHTLSDQFVLALGRRKENIKTLKDVSAP